jgi:hypothetical protein
MVSCQIRNGSKEVAPLTNLLTYRLSLCEGLFVTFFFALALPLPVFSCLYSGTLGLKYTPLLVTEQCIMFSIFTILNFLLSV